MESRDAGAPDEETRGGVTGEAQIQTTGAYCSDVENVVRAQRCGWALCGGACPDRCPSFVHRCCGLHPAEGGALLFFERVADLGAAWWWEESENEKHDGGLAVKA